MLLRFEEEQVRIRFREPIVVIVPVYGITLVANSARKIGTDDIWVSIVTVYDAHGVGLFHEELFSAAKHEGEIVSDLRRSMLKLGYQAVENMNLDYYKLKVKEV